MTALLSVLFEVRRPARADAANKVFAAFRANLSKLLRRTAARQK